MKRLAWLIAVVCALAISGVAWAAATVKFFQVGSYSLRWYVADTHADLPTSGPPEGALAYVKDSDEVECFNGSAWSNNCFPGAGSGAPSDAEYIVGATDTGLSAERVGTDTTEIDWDYGTAGQAKLNLIDDTVEVSRLKTSDTPGDGECLIYESTGDEVAFGACGGGSGTVTSVALTMPAEFSVSGSPVTTDGTLAVTEATQSANTVYAGPTTGGAAAPGFRALVDADVPDTITISNAVNNRRPSFGNPPASPSSYDCEFDSGSCANWDWTSATAATGPTPSSGTVGPLTSSTDTIYDASTWPGWLLWQSDEQAGLTNILSRPWTSVTNATLFAHLSSDNLAVSTAGESNSCIGFFVAADSNERAIVCYGKTATVSSLYCDVNNNGTLSSFTSAGGAGETIPTTLDYIAIWKSGDSYYCGGWSEGGQFSGVSTALTKTGVTTFDEVGFFVSGANETPSTISGIDFFRYYASITYALVNP